MSTSGSQRSYDEESIISFGSIPDLPDIPEISADHQEFVITSPGTSAPLRSPASTSVRSFIDTSPGSSAVSTDLLQSLPRYLCTARNPLNLLLEVLQVRCPVLHHPPVLAMSLTVISEKLSAQEESMTVWKGHWSTRRILTLTQRGRNLLVIIIWWKHYVLSVVRSDVWRISLWSSWVLAERDMCNVQELNVTRV